MALGLLREGRVVSSMHGKRTWNNEAAKMDA
jgi:hypothetical protein